MLQGVLEVNSRSDDDDDDVSFIGSTNNNNGESHYNKSMGLA